MEVKAKLEELRERRAEEEEYLAARAQERLETEREERRRVAQQEVKRFRERDRQKQEEQMIKEKEREAAEQERAKKLKRLKGQVSLRKYIINKYGVTSKPPKKGIFSLFHIRKKKHSLKKFIFTQM